MNKIISKAEPPNLEFIDVLRACKTEFAQGNLSKYLKIFCKEKAITGIFLENCIATINHCPEIASSALALKILLEILAESEFNRMDYSAQAILFLYLRKPDQLDEIITAPINRLLNSNLDQKMGQLVSSLAIMTVSEVVRRLYGSVFVNIEKKRKKIVYKIGEQTALNKIRGRVGFASIQQLFQSWRVHNHTQLPFFDLSKIPIYDLIGSDLEKKPEDFFKKNGHFLVHTYSNNYSTDSYFFVGCIRDKLFLFCSIFHNDGKTHYRKCRKLEFVAHEDGFCLDIPDKDLQFEPLGALSRASVKPIKSFVFDSIFFQNNFKPFIPEGLCASSLHLMTLEPETSSISSLSSDDFDSVIEERDLEGIPVRDLLENIPTYHHNVVKISNPTKSAIPIKLNASLLDLRGIGFSPQFIAAQGPKDSANAGNFLTMLIQKNSRLVVCIGQPTEKNETFYQYWPNEKEETLIFKNSFGQDVRITLKSNPETDDKKWIWKRILALQIGESEPFIIEQFHIHKWEASKKLDVDVFRAIVAFVMPQGEFPITVHCSKGEGRTGTYIAGVVSLYTDWNARAITFVLKRMRKNIICTQEEFDLINTFILNTNRARIEPVNWPPLRLSHKFEIDPDAVVDRWNEMGTQGLLQHNEVVLFQVWLNIVLTDHDSRRQEFRLSPNFYERCLEDRSSVEYKKLVLMCQLNIPDPSNALICFNHDKTKILFMDRETIVSWDTLQHSTWINLQFFDLTKFEDMALLLKKFEERNNYNVKTLQLAVWEQPPPH